ncbi:MAG: S8 family serine peptidase, partial [Chloroflexota bacterium]
MLSMHFLKRSFDYRSILWLGLLYLFLGSIFSLNSLFQPSQAAIAQNDPVVGQLSDKAAESGTVRVIVRLNIPFEPVGDLDSPQAVNDQLFQIDRVQDALVESISAEGVKVTADFKTIPFIGLEVDTNGLDALLESEYILSIEEDVPEPPLLRSSGDLFGANAAYEHNVTGEGQTIAILDTGVERDHDAFYNDQGDSRIVSEACYSSITANSQTVCPGGVEASTAAGSGTDCVDSVSGYSDAEDDCTHGTHVAGIAAGYDDDQQVYGVAPEANIIAIQVFSLFTSVNDCVYSDDCVLTYRSDQILGLERVYELRNTYNIASANMSLGGGKYTAACDSDSRKTIIDNLASVGIATVIAAGNSGYVDGVGAPACISTAITVGSTDDDDTVASYSNIGPQIDLVAPGTSIFAAVPSNAYDTKQGTSMAAPQIAGAWALIKELDSDASVNSVLAALTSGATLIDDDRGGTPQTDMPRPNLLEAINALAPALTLDLVASNRYLSAGERLTYTLHITNETDVSASNLLITATVPAETTLDPNSLSGDATYSGVAANSVITWSIAASLTADAAISRQFAVEVTADYTEGGFISSVSNITATEMTRSVTDSQTVTVNAPKACGYT